MSLSVQKFPTIKVKDIKGNYIDFITKKNSTTLLIFFDPLNTEHKGKLVYAQVLYNKFKIHGLEVIGISSKDRIVTEDFQIRGKLTFSIIADRDQKIYEKFQLNNCCGGILLVSNNKQILFQTQNLVQNENLRQLVEKALFGEISYELQVKHSTISERMPLIISALLMRKKYSSEFKSIWDFKEDYLVLTFFSSMCSFCKSGNRVRILRILSKWYQENRIKPDIRFILVFFEPYDENDIEFWEQKMEMPFDIYISEDFFTDEEKYITDQSIKLDPLTLVLNKKREVIFLKDARTNEKEILGSLKDIFLNK